MSSETVAREYRRIHEAPAPAPTALFHPLRSRVFLAGMLVMLVVAAVSRLPMVFAASDSYRTTEAFNTEETESIRLSTGMIHDRTLNPHGFLYPSLHYDVSVLAELPLVAAKRLTWTSALITVRTVSLLLGLGTLFLAGWLAARVGGPLAGLLAGALLTFDRTLMQSSALAKPDSLHELLVVSGFVALVGLVEVPRLRSAVIAAVLFGLAAAAKWFGGAGLLGVALAPALATGGGDARGVARLGAVVRDALRVRLTAVQWLLPLLAFAAVFFLATPYAILSPREFAFGFGVSFTAQGMHQHASGLLVPLRYLGSSLGPAGAVFAAVGMIWAIARLLRWAGAPRDNALLLVTGWALAYGALVLLVFVKVPSYLDLWVPFLGVIAGCAWAGEHGLLRTPAFRAAAIALALIAGAYSGGGWSAARAESVARDTRTASARWLTGHRVTLRSGAHRSRHAGARRLHERGPQCVGQSAARPLRRDHHLGHEPRVAVVARRTPPAGVRERQVEAAARAARPAAALGGDFERVGREPRTARRRQRVRFARVRREPRRWPRGLRARHVSSRGCTRATRGRRSARCDATERGCSAGRPSRSTSAWEAVDDARAPSLRAWPGREASVMIASVLDPRRVAIHRQPAAHYPEKAPFHPAVRHPELPQDLPLDPTNTVFGSVRELCSALDLDAERFGSPAWNPLGTLVRPGDTVFLKPNMIAHRHRLRDEWDSVITHGSVIRAVAEDLRGAGARGPWPHLDRRRAAAGLAVGGAGRARDSKLREYFAARGIPVEILDLRDLHHVDQDGIYVAEQRLPGDPRGSVVVDLARDSLFAELDGAGRRYYGTSTTGRADAHHHEGRPEFRDLRLRR